MFIKVVAVFPLFLYCNRIRAYINFLDLRLLALILFDLKASPPVGKLHE